MHFGGHMSDHPKSGIQVDVSVYEGVGGRVVRSSYDDTDKAIDIH